MLRSTIHLTDVWGLGARRRDRRRRARAVGGPPGCRTRGDAVVPSSITASRGGVKAVAWWPYPVGVIAISQQPSTTVARPRQGGIVLTEEFRHALDILEAGGNLFLTGKAGTGKSTLIRGA